MSALPSLSSPSLSPDQTLLTPVIEIPTGVPAPSVPFARVNSDPGLIYADGNRTIVINACSEFLQETVPLRALDGGKRLRVLRDASSQPLLFSIGNDDRLYCTVGVEGSSQGWQVFDITPFPQTLAKVITFDALKIISGKIVLSSAFLAKDGQVYVCWALLEPFSCTWDASTSRVIGFDPSLPWKRVVNELNSKNITSITLAPAPPTASSLFQILISTAAAANTVGSHFLVNPTPGIAQDTWREVKVPETATRVLDTAPANIWEGAGLFSLYRRADNSTGCTFDSLKNSFHYRMPLNDVGEARSITPNPNPWNMTDLFVAGSNGIGFFNFSHPDLPPEVILPGTGFSQVASFEAVDAQRPTEQSKIVAFAVSDDQRLFYFEGIRPYATNVVKFTASGFPIATGVAEISTQYNPKFDTSELVYLGNEVNEVRRLTRAAGSSGWSSSKVLVHAPSGFTKHPAYMTTLSFVRDDGQSIGGDYPVRISSDIFVEATVNDLSRAIGPAPSTFLTDGDGKIHISVPVDDSLGGPHYSITLTKFTATPKTFTANAAQRVLRKLGEIQSGADLREATSTDGRKVFDQAAGPKLDDAGSLLSNFSSMLSSADPDTAKRVLKSPPQQTKDFSLGFTRNNDGSVVRDNGSWLERAIETVEDAIADFFEFLRSNIKAVVKFAVKAIGKVVVFAFNILGKVIKFVIKSVGPLVRGLASFLKTYLGIDITSFLDWLSFIFDTEKARETQKVLMDMYHNCKRVTIDLTKVKVSSAEAELTNSLDSLKRYIKDDRPPLVKGTKNNLVTDIIDSPLGKGIKFLVDNPIWKTMMRFNPMTIFMEALIESVSEELSGFGYQGGGTSVVDKLTAIFSDFIEKEFDNITRLVEDIKGRIEEAIKSNGANFEQALAAVLGDSIWTLLDAIKILIVSLLDAVVAVVEGVADFMDGEWKLGWISDLFTEWSGQPLTIMNLLTMLGAQALNIVTYCTMGVYPLEAFGNPNELFPLPTTSQVMALGKSQPAAAAMRTENVFSARTVPHARSEGEATETDDGIVFTIQDNLTAEAEEMVNTFAFYNILMSLGSTMCGCVSSALCAATAITGEDWEKAMEKVGNGKSELERAINRNPSTDKMASLGPGPAAVCHLICDLGQVVARTVNMAMLDHYCRTNSEFRRLTPWWENRIAITTVAWAVNVVDIGYRFTCSFSVLKQWFRGQQIQELGNKTEAVGDFLQLCVCTLNMADNSFTMDKKLAERLTDKGCAVSSIVSAGFGMVTSGTSCALRFHKDPYLVLGVVATAFFDAGAALFAGGMGFASLAAISDENRKKAKQKAS